jgi:hypothetical protein
VGDRQKTADRPGVGAHIRWQAAPFRSLCVGMLSRAANQRSAAKHDVGQGSESALDRVAGLGREVGDGLGLRNGIGLVASEAPNDRVVGHGRGGQWRGPGGEEGPPRNALGRLGPCAQAVQNGVQCRCSAGALPWQWRMASRAPCAGRPGLPPRTWAARSVRTCSVGGSADGSAGDGAWA